jgi:peptide/nickel transport system substrate-binding protein
MFDTLVAPQDESGKLEGDLAESWEASADNKTYTFHLRAGIKFSDGSPITADDVKFSIDRMKTGEIMKGQLANVTAVTVVDPNTVTVALSQPSGALAVTLSRPGSAVILPMKAVQAKADYFSLPDPVSGPYILKELVPKDHASFVANPNYWKTGFPKIKNLVQTFSEDQNSWAAAVESGTIDIAAVGYADAQRLKKEGKIPVLQNDQLAPLFWGWNWRKPPFDNQTVRQAFAYAFDRQGRIDACWFGTGAVTYGNILRPWDPNYIEIDTYKLDPAAGLAKAASMLDSVGWKVGPDGTRVSTGVAGEPDGTKFSVQVPYEGNWPAAECNTLLLQSTMKKIGVDIQPQKYDPAAFWGDVAADKFTMYHGGAGATGAQDLYLDWFHTGGGLTPLTTHLKDPSIDKQIDQAVGTGDANAAKAIYQSLEKWQSDFLPMMVTGYQWLQIALSPKVQGYFQAPGGYTKWGLLNTTLTP